MESFIKKHSLQKIPALIFFLLIISIFSVLLSDQLLKKNTGKVDKLQEGTGNSGKIELPVALDEQGVTNLYLSYNFFGSVKEISRIDDGYQLTLEVENDNIPPFIIKENDTRVFRVNNQKEISAIKASDLKEGMNVSISSTYDVKDREWVTRTVHVVDGRVAS